MIIKIKNSQYSSYFDIKTPKIINIVAIYKKQLEKK
jgi:hypothetical protein